MPQPTKADKDNYILSIDCDWVKNPSQHQDLLDYYIEKIKNVKEVYFSANHHYHYPFVPANSIVVNIDDHHDLGYQDWQYQNIDKGIMDEASWVLALIRYKKIKGYIWISNYDSEFGKFMRDNFAKVRLLPIYKRYFDFKNISDIEYNRVLVCESFDYSTQGKYVYYSLLSIAKAMNKKILFMDNVPNSSQLINVK